LGLEAIDGFGVSCFEGGALLRELRKFGGGDGLQRVGEDAASSHDGEVTVVVSVNGVDGTDAKAFVTIVFQGCSRMNGNWATPT
jgi:hypothetical protein